MSPDVAGELTQLCDDPDGPSAPEVLRAIAAGVRRGGHLAITPGELDEIAAELGRLPWP